MEAAAEPDETLGRRLNAHLVLPKRTVSSVITCIKDGLIGLCWKHRIEWSDIIEFPDRKTDL